ncbi:MAG: hypothetical protein AAGG68_28740 [Bacteroidota bacterium]
MDKTAVKFKSLRELTKHLREKGIKTKDICERIDVKYTKYNNLMRQDGKANKIVEQEVMSKVINEFKEFITDQDYIEVVEETNSEVVQLRKENEMLKNRIVEMSKVLVQLVGGEGMKKIDEKLTTILKFWGGMKQAA